MEDKDEKDVMASKIGASAEEAPHIGGSRGAGEIGDDPLFKRLLEAVERDPVRTERRTHLGQLKSPTSGRLVSLWLVERRFLSLEPAAAGQAVGRTEVQRAHSRTTRARSRACARARRMGMSDEAARQVGREAYAAERQRQREASCQPPPHPKDE